uniref:Uncharacterized protein n=1 Tax=Felis catus TaxID=9685 RepID=A0ABI7X6F6_FELCA
MAPARPLSGGPVLGYVAAAVWEGSAPRIQQAREDRALGVLLGENAAKFIFLERENYRPQSNNILGDSLYSPIFFYFKRNSK